MSARPTNRILSALPADERARLMPELHETQMALGDVVYESGGSLDHVCFPISCIVSLIYTMQDGSVAEIGLIGNDGMVGVALFMGGNTMPNRAITQVAGKAVRLEAT